MHLFILFWILYQLSEKYLLKSYQPLKKNLQIHTIQVNIHYFLFYRGH